MPEDTTAPPGPGDPTAPPDPSDTTTASEESPRRPRPVFARSSTDRVLGGVAGGLARTFDIDPVVVRIVTVVGVLAFPPTLLAYLAAWLVVARDDEPSRPPTSGIAVRQSGGIAFWVGVVVLVAAALAALEDPFGGGGFDLLPLVLIGIGIALWTRDGGRRTAPTTAAWPAAAGPGDAMTGGAMPSTSTPPAPTSTQTAWGPGGPPVGGPPTAHPAGPAPLPVGPPPPPPPRSPLGAITIGLALVTTGVVAALDQVEGLPLDADASHLAAVALLVLGIGQLVGSVWGRARWLSLVAIFLIPPVVAGAVIREVDDTWDLGAGEFSVADGIGERVITPFGPAPLPDDVRLAAGSVRVDLSAWLPEEEAALAGDEDLRIDVGAGEVILVVPEDVAWRIVGEVRIGEIWVDDTAGDDARLSTEDVGESLRIDRSGGPAGGEVLDIRADVRLGQLTVVVHDQTQELS